MELITTLNQFLRSGQLYFFLIYVGLGVASGVCLAKRKQSGQNFFAIVAILLGTLSIIALAAGMEGLYTAIGSGSPYQAPIPFVRGFYIASAILIFGSLVAIPLFKMAESHALVRAAAMYFLGFLGSLMIIFFLFTYQ